MADFPSTTVGGVTVPRLIIGTNWFLGYSHQSCARDKFIHKFQDRHSIADVLETFFKSGCNAILGPTSELLVEAIEEVQDRTGQKAIVFMTPCFDLKPGGDYPLEKVLDGVKKMGATFALPHQSVTDALLDMMEGKIRRIDEITKAIRERGMLPGLSSHTPESLATADRTGADVDTYMQIYNAAGFMMHVEIDWTMRLIKNAKKPVIAFKPLAAGRLMPAEVLAFVWNTIRDQDMVCVGTTTPDEAAEIIELSHDYISRRLPENVLQKTRSKKSLE